MAGRRTGERKEHRGTFWGERGVEIAVAAFPTSEVTYIHTRLLMRLLMLTLGTCIGVGCHWRLVEVEYWELRSTAQSSLQFAT